MINIHDVSNEQGCIKIKVGEARIYGDKITIGRTANFVGTVIKIFDESGRVNAIIPFGNFTPAAIGKIKKIWNTEVIEETDTEETDTEDKDFEEFNINELMKNLKPCPFCGRKDLSLIYLDEEGYQQEHYSELTDSVGIHCGHCYLTMTEQIFFFKDSKELFKRWNQRGGQ